MFKDIVGYEGLYQINEEGIVRTSRKDLKWIPVSGQEGKPYYMVCLYDRKGNRKQLRVHRLVAETFLPNPDNLPQVNHKDENPANNHKDNLEWCTAAYNNDYSKSKDWAFINPEGEKIEIRNLNKYCRENNLDMGNMSNLAKGKLKSYKGYRSYEFA